MALLVRIYRNSASPCKLFSSYIKQVKQNCFLGRVGKVVTENGWILNFQFRKVVQWHIYGVVGNAGMILLQISSGILWDVKK